MKTLFFLSLFAASLAAANLEAQVYVAGAQVEPVAAPAVVYQAPVVYEAPVIYQGPVVYGAPVVYQGAVMAEQIGGDCYHASPNVVYFGGPDSAYHNATAQNNPCSTVIYFGRGESAQRGYQFRHPR